MNLKLEKCVQINDGPYAGRAGLIVGHIMPDIYFVQLLHAQLLPLDRARGAHNIIQENAANVKPLVFKPRLIAGGKPLSPRPLPPNGGRPAPVPKQAQLFDPMRQAS